MLATANKGFQYIILQKKKSLGTVHQFDKWTFKQTQILLF